MSPYIYRTEVSMKTEVHLYINIHYQTLSPTSFTRLHYNILYHIVYLYMIF